MADEDRFTFAEIATKAANDMGSWLLDNINEVRGVAVVVDYVGDLNNSSIPAIVCLGRSGSLKTAAELVGMNTQLLKLIQFLTEKLHALNADGVQALQKLIERHKQLEEESGEEKAKQG